MSDFTSDFWSVYVAVLTIVSVVACGILLYVMGRMRVVQGKSPDTTGHVWDEDLAEYNNPLPRWWMWLFYITIAFGFLYLALYPGLGKLPGLLGWTSAEAYAKERATFDKEVAPLYAKYRDMDAAAIAKDPAAPGDRRAAVPQQLCPMPRLRRRGQQGLPQPARRRLAVRRGPGRDQRVDHRWPQRRNASIRHRPRPARASTTS